MSVLVLLAVGLVGGVGAVARFALDGTVGALHGGSFPVGTLAVNISGSFVLGVLSGLVLGADAYRVVATGMIGAFTTFSTWVLETQRLGEDGQLGLGAANLAVSLALGMSAVWLGRQLGGLL